ncbi:VOC family protein [Streptomonospora litoralis]|uniref:Glyoxalase-like domain protein n=1 Tax=Streptomonospora litoralis TaxID=2498135 RepID=A0A4P6Q090_9ACTN|nr:VOC family protein [Streptomonospora litoralis]QBI51927.1 Glyoxalase-like domain protein [Streptomonospora litoralis]
MAAAEHNLICYLCVDGAAAALDFYRRAFGATEDQRWTGEDGRIGHARMTVEGMPVYLADEHPEIGVRGPHSYGGTAVSLVLTVADADAAFDAAVAAGATVERPVADQPHGARTGWLRDPFGHRWGITSTTAEVSEEELRGRVGDSYTIS